jgi:hypothetical protein
LALFSENPFYSAAFAIPVAALIFLPSIVANLRRVRAFRPIAALNAVMLLPKAG